MNKAYIICSEGSHKRIAFGIGKIIAALEKVGYKTEYIPEPENYHDYRHVDGEKIYVGLRGESGFINWLEREELLLYHSKTPDNEGFYIQTCPARLTVISAATPTGALYGCMELAGRIDSQGEYPRELAYYDAPVFKLRGPSIGLQLTTLEPPRLTYEYPITPSRFPWFYDKCRWQKFLDMLLLNRCNILYIWSGHPFSSLVKLPDYPEALEVTEEEFNRNKEVFGWLTEECDKRGIWVVLKFYNIHIPYPFAQKHGLELLQKTISPLVADYTAKSIIEFIKSFPHIGLMVCLGEALRGTQNKTDWFAKTIIPAVKEGAAQAGLKEDPPIILRGHDCDPNAAMSEGMKNYSNIYTMWKYNGEGLTTYLPRGEWQEKHLSLCGLGEAHIMNVHVLADLEPFRFNAPEYIRKCVQAGQNRLGANGLHLYPLFYWDWPYSPDKAEPRIEQLDRDWLWYKAWFRYAWNPDRDEKGERDYWIYELSKQYRINPSAAELLLDAMESAGQCAPKILGRVGITEGNRQTMSLGMTMSQFTNVKRYRPNLQLWYSVARKGEQPDDYIAKKIAGEPHIGETPYDMIDDVMYFARRAVDKYVEAQKLAECGLNGLCRIADDIQAIYHMSKSYCKKVEAALKILEYKYTMHDDCSGNTLLLREALPLMQESLEEYKKLTVLTEKTYLYANSMQTPQRKIPFENGLHFGHWVQCLPEYEKEYVNFKKHLEELENGILPGMAIETEEIIPLTGAGFELTGGNGELYTLKKGEQIFTDSLIKIQNITPELDGLTGIRFGMGDAISQGAAVKIKLHQDSKILIGYFQAAGVEWLQVPDLETNTHADDRGGLRVVYSNAIKAEGCPVVNIHSFNYEKGEYELYFGTGSFVIVGVVGADEKLTSRDAGMDGEALDTLDWLYAE